MVAAVTTVVGLTAAITGAVIAYRQFRQQTDVLKGEIERNKRRDELLDGQLLDLKERQQDRAREQAEGVRVSWNDEFMSGFIRNKSRRPITKVVAGMAVPLPDGGTETHQAGQWRMLDMRGRYEIPPNAQAGPTVPTTPGPVPVIRPRAGAQCLFEPNQMQGENRRLVVRFYDDAGRRWQLDHYMHLEPAPDDGW